MSIQTLTCWTAAAISLAWILAYLLTLGAIFTLTLCALWPVMLTVEWAKAR